PFAGPQHVYELKGEGIREGYYFFTEEQTPAALLSACSGAESDTAPEQASVKVKSGSRVIFGNGWRVEDMGAQARLNFFLPLSVNTATAEDLALIPGVGMQTAQAIVAYRKTHNGSMDVGELKAIKSFGEKKLQTLEPYLME
ncbi:MAG: helix-hairpin-helix domain-containing protein, partial [Pseudomonadota bacterium]